MRGVIERGWERGMTLTEVVVAVTVLTIAGVGLFHLASTSITGAVRGRDQVAATQLAADKLEELKSASFTDLASGTDSTAVTAGGEEGGIYTRTWTVSSRTIAGAPARDITVSVSWVGGGSTVLSTTVVQPTTLYSAYMRSFSAVSIRGWNQER